MAAPILLANTDPMPIQHPDILPRSPRVYMSPTLKNFSEKSYLVRQIPDILTTSTVEGRKCIVVNDPTLAHNNEQIIIYSSAVPITTSDPTWSWTVGMWCYFR